MFTASSRPPLTFVCLSASFFSQIDMLKQRVRLLLKLEQTKLAMIKAGLYLPRGDKTTEEQQKATEANAENAENAETAENAKAAENAEQQTETAAGNENSENAENTEPQTTETEPESNAEGADQP